jgi:hypothetical protein
MYVLGLAMIDIPDGFYVYRLCDPRTNAPFYVGKGQGRRAWQHEAEFRRGAKGSNSKKVAVIADIVSAGLNVLIEIVASYEREADALDHEYRLVDADGTLTNIAQGGIGTAMSPARRRELERDRERALLRKRQIALQAAAARDRARELHAKARVFSVAKEDKHIHEVAAWASSLPNGVASAMRMPSPQALRLQAQAKRDAEAKRRQEQKTAGEIGTYAGRIYPRKRGLYGKYR